MTTTPPRDDSAETARSELAKALEALSRVCLSRPAVQVTTHGAAAQDEMASQ